MRQSKENYLPKKDTTNLRNQPVLDLVLISDGGLHVVPKGSLEFRIIEVKIKGTIVFLAFLAVFCPRSNDRMTLRSRHCCLASVEECLHQSPDLQCGCPNLSEIRGVRKYACYPSYHNSVRRHWHKVGLPLTSVQ